MNINLQLIDNIKKNNTSKVIELLKQGANINYNNGEPLLCSINLHLYDMAKLLIDYNADINNSDFLFAACNSNQSEIVELLLDNGCECGLIVFELIDICSGNDDIESIKLFIKHGFEFEYYADCLVEPCLENKEINMLQFIIENYLDAIIDEDISKYINKSKIRKYHFIKMLIDRQIIDLPD